MQDWMADAAKVAAGIVVALIGVWGARITRAGSLAETLRRQEESIRKYLKEELLRRDEEVARRNDELDRLKGRVHVLEHAQGQVRRLVRQALDRLALGQPVDDHFAAIIKALDDGETV